jgi:hypothetical protein
LAAASTRRSSWSSAADERKAFQIANALGCATRLSLEVLGELRLILRLMRWKKMHREFREIVAMLCEAPITAAAE